MVYHHPPRALKPGEPCCLFLLSRLFELSLLILVQPMVGKMILPRLGGTPAVWNTCMVFFQGVLLVGYAYAHSLSTWHDRRRQVLIQLGLLLIPFLVLPFALGAWSPPTESNPVLSVLWLLLGLVGLPFFVVSTVPPLLQALVLEHPAIPRPRTRTSFTEPATLAACLPCCSIPSWSSPFSRWRRKPGSGPPAMSCSSSSSASVPGSSGEAWTGVDPALLDCPRPQRRPLRKQASLSARRHDPARA